MMRPSVPQRTLVARNITAFIRQGYLRGPLRPNDRPAEYARVEFDQRTDKVYYAEYAT